MEEKNKLGQSNTLLGYFGLPGENNDSLCRQIVDDLLTYTIVESNELVFRILNDLLSQVVK